MKEEVSKKQIKEIIIDRFRIESISDNNDYFLFEDKASQTYKVYYLFNKDKNIEVIKRKLTLRNINAQDNDQYEFKLKYEIDISKTDLF